MKLLGNLLLTVSLVLAMISAATSYVGFVSADSDFSEDGGFARLKAPAGAIANTDADLDGLRAQYDAGAISAEAYTARRLALAPVMAEDLDDGGTLLDPERVAELDTASVKTVFMKSFAFGRWRFWWLFLLSAVGLLTGSLMVRKAAQEEIAAAAAESGDTGSKLSPTAALDGLTESMSGLRRDLDGMQDDPARLAAILDRVSTAQLDYVEPFIEARPLLVGQRGLGGYAELMDRFAAAERQVNRAWSSAADGVLEESVECLANAEELLLKTKELM